MFTVKQFSFLPLLIASTASALPLSSIKSEEVCIVQAFAYYGNDRTFKVLDVPVVLSSLLSQVGLKIKKANCNHTVLLKVETLNLSSTWSVNAYVTLSTVGGEVRQWEKVRAGVSTTPATPEFITAQGDLAIIEATLLFLEDWKESHRIP